MGWTESLRFRLLAGAAVWVALALMLAGWIIADLFQTHVRQRFEAELTNHLEQLAAVLEIDADGRPALRQPLSDPRFRRPLSGLYWQVGESAATPLRSRSLWDSVLALPDDRVENGGLHRHDATGPANQSLTVLERFVLLPERAEPVRIAVAADRAELAGVTRAFNATLALSLAVLAAALIVAALIQVQIGLSPLSRLRGELTEVRAGRKKGFDVAMPTEIRPLVEDLNALLAHAEEVVGRGRLQAGNLAHALKTNLAVLANEAGALDERNARTVGAAMVRQVELMRRHVDHHMARARAAAARSVPGISTPVADCVAALVRVMRKLHAQAGLDINVDAPAGLLFAGEREDLDEMLGNLLDNACKWARGRVEVTCRAEGGGMLSLVLDDDGPGLPDDCRETALEPGVRLDESMPGTGLGLAVVRDVARLYGGDVRLDASPLGGLRAVLRLPAAAG
ncbi:signal transduction histidine kinase [Azospirillum lipoferum]|uniref:histidine kinase n=1 Tax=Azospirillum lipoferum TaxID=193 RepID=A0A5A9GF91_AZOLI|nr:MULTISPECIES: sensor histidine kinase [Azospirillum]KAA0592374.1 sensor histidine kinase [Azospirillum lipoferum]MCP1614593.1 signal transduction histidine kinase [Azospirillum lipoferum]MDW5532576.1 sensor histidine kinase [Azospirillum sp. NL1]